MKLTENYIKKLVKESLGSNLFLDTLYARAMSGNKVDLGQLKLLLQSGSSESIAWLNSKIAGIEEEMAAIDKEIKRMEELPYDPYYDDATQSLIMDMYVDTDLLQKQINYLKSLASKKTYKEYSFIL